MKQKIIVIETWARFTVAFIFAYHALVPKLLWVSSTEVLMIEANSLPWATQWVIYAGAGFDLLIALLIVLFRQRRWPILLAGAALIALLANVALFSPQLLVEAFNPVTLNIAGLVLCVIALQAMTLRRALDARALCEENRYNQSTEAS